MFLQNPLKYICQHWTVLIANTSDENPAMNNEWTCFLHLIHHTNLHHTPLLLHLSYSQSVLHHLAALNTQICINPPALPNKSTVYSVFMPQLTVLSSFWKSFSRTRGNRVRDPVEGNSWGLQAHGCKMWAAIVSAHGPYYPCWSLQLCHLSVGGLIQMLQMRWLVILKIRKPGRLLNVAGETQDITLLSPDVVTN